MEVLGGDLANEMSPPCDSASALDRPFYVLNVLSHGGLCVGQAETSQCSQLTLGLNFAGGCESRVTNTLLYNRGQPGGTDGQRSQEQPQTSLRTVMVPARRQAL